MPKILINEKDRTSPGTPDSYANFSVLIAGLANKDMSSARTAAQDSNGVCEFSSAEAFKNTIGLVPPEVKYTPAEVSPSRLSDTSLL